MMHDQLRKATEAKDRDSVNRCMNVLLQRVVEAVQTNEWPRLRETEQEIADALIPYRQYARSASIDESFLAGELYALHGLVNALRENRASVADLSVARHDRRRQFLLALRRSGTLRTRDLKQQLRLEGESADSQISHLGSFLEKAGLVRRDRKGKGGSYWLTSRGSIVARELQQEANEATEPPKVFNSSPVSADMLLSCMQTELLRSWSQNDEPLAPIRDSLASIGRLDIHVTLNPIDRRVWSDNESQESHDRAGLKDQLLREKEYLANAE